MMRRKGTGLGVLSLIVAAGCGSIDVRGRDFAFQGRTTPLGAQGGAAILGNQVVQGTVDEVAASMQASLEALGMTAVVIQDGDQVSVKGKRPDGKELAFVLQREQTAQGQQTRVRLASDPNGQGLQLLTDLGRRGGKFSLQGGPLSVNANLNAN
jgi:hypothetical protein